jgi:hypothetical protein
MIAAYVCRTESNNSTTSFKRNGRRGEFVLTTYHLGWDKGIIYHTCCYSFIVIISLQKLIIIYLWMLKQYLISSAYAEQKKNNHWHK